jgi:hypothetical protein
VYNIPPSASHQGHRADSWDVEKWLRAVRVKVTSKGDRGAIKLEDQASGELFAACPLPRDAPVSTVVEPVIDSSRYFVLRVEDEATRRHAFLGLGFRERDAASDFKLAVQEHQRSLNRDKAAAAARAEYERTLAEKNAARAAVGEDSAAKLHDFSLRGSITIAVPGGGADAGREGARGAGHAEPTSTTAADAAAPAFIAPLAPPPSAVKDAGAGAVVQEVQEGWANFEAPAEDDWADFQS